MLTDDLKSLGLTENETQVYLALIHLGKVRAAEVIKQTGLHRNLVYQAFEALSERHLVTKTTAAGVFQFQTTDPEHLRDRLREEDQIATRAIESLKERGRLSEQEIIIYEGDEAIRNYSLKIANELRPGESIHVLGSGGTRYEKAMGERDLKTYYNTIAKQKGNIKLLTYPSQTYSTSTTTMLGVMPNVEIRMLPFHHTPAANVVFTNHTVAFQIFEKPYTVIEIKNALLVEAYRQYFSILWNQRVHIDQGIDALRAAFIGMIDELQPGEEYYVLGGNLGSEYERMNDFFDEIHRYRISKGVIANILAQREAALNIRERNRRVGDPEEHLSHTKTFNTPFLAPMQINMVNGRAYMVLYKGSSPTVIYFEDKEVHDGFMLYFNEIWNRQTESLRGHEGIMSLCDRVLEEGKDLHLIAATGTILKTHPKEYAEFTRQRVVKGMQIHMLANEEIRGTPATKLPLTNVKYLPKAFASPMVVWIFGDYVANVLWHEPETIFLLRDAKTADYYRTYFAALEESANQ